VRGDVTTKVPGILRRIRELMGDESRRKGLQRKARWLHVCACLDVISDTEQAILAYRNQREEEHGVLYLTTYGVLQAFVTQQDAVGHLAAALDHPIDGWPTKKGDRMNWGKHPLLREIRTIRVRAAGHPSLTRGINGQPAEYHFVVQQTLHAGYFEMQSWSAAKAKSYDERRRVDVIKLAADQQQCIGNLLQCLRDALVGDASSTSLSG